MPEFSLDTDKTSLDLTVLLPAYNEEAAITLLIQQTHDSLAEWPGTWEILVVDDASTDKTSDKARESSVRVIRRVENGGSGASRITGILAGRGRLIAMLDADGTYDPSSLPELLSHFPDYDQVNGARDSEQGTLPLFRIPAKWIIRRIAELISGRRIPDLNTGLKVFKRDIMLQYLWAIPNGFSCVTSMTLAFLCNGHPVKYVPVSYRKRIGLSKFHPIHDTARYGLTVLRIMTCFQPLRVFLPIAFLLFAVGVVRSAIHISNSKLGMTDSDVLLCISGVLIFSLGLLADLIVRQRKCFTDPRPDLECD